MRASYSRRGGKKSTPGNENFLSLQQQNEAHTTGGSRFIVLRVGRQCKWTAQPYVYAHVGGVASVECWLWRVKRKRARKLLWIKLELIEGARKWTKSRDINYGLSGASHFKFMKCDKLHETRVGFAKSWDRLMVGWCKNLLWGVHFHFRGFFFDKNHWRTIPRNNLIPEKEWTKNIYSSDGNPFPRPSDRLAFKSQILKPKSSLNKSHNHCSEARN